MTIALYVAAALTIAVAVAHSFLGERYILIRLFRRDNLPKLFGGTEFTRQTLRFAWHITSLAWLGFAALLVALAQPSLSRATPGLIIAVTFVAHGLVSLIASKGRHLSWPVFLAIGLLAYFATR